MVPDDSAGPDAPSGRRPVPLVALAVLLFLEAAGLVVLVAWLVLELITVGPQSFASAVAILVLALLATAWLIVTAVSTLRARSWIRASAVTWQVLQIAVAIGSFQGLYARPDLGWALLVPALVGIGLALSPAVIRATSRPRVDDEES